MLVVLQVYTDYFTFQKITDHNTIDCLQFGTLFTLFSAVICQYFTTLFTIM